MAIAGAEVDREAGRGDERPRRSWWPRPWVAPLGAVIVVFLAFSLPPYLGLDAGRSRVPAPEGFAAHYPVLLVHIGFGPVAMVSGFLQVWPWFRGRFPRAHRRLGRVYVFAGVLPAAVAGFVVGVVSPFGPVARVSAMVLAPVWFVTTVVGYRRARQRRFGEHREWMIRSFALTVSTITNRFWAPVVAVVLTPSLDTTFGGSELALGQAIAGITAWLGWTLPLLGVEWWLHRRPSRRTAG
ncbi:DUF2306 domain-containing protein [Actinokineospora iranica]|uniref:Predicted membrane protein n=1 Tax=Actinokineospora iranica TaxID=1271860 RepID=A0A1G6RXH6_9PSEU|nr:DUF2306 domain-containing protein [Actinokineospora iranica]SDD09362.1 Predicted membrane protein [Actinokineospora iranica]